MLSLKSVIALLQNLEDNIKIDLQEIVTKDVDWIQLAEDKDQ
jgi:hypothetical protein